MAVARAAAVAANSPRGSPKNAMSMGGKNGGWGQTMAADVRLVPVYNALYVLHLERQYSVLQIYPVGASVSRCALPPWRTGCA